MTMKIRDIVSINSQAVLSNAIQLAWYDAPDQQSENDRLVAGYVFGNEVNTNVGGLTEMSSLPVFEKIRDSFGNPQSNNIFTIIAKYGHGKSHFALVLANYFGLAPESKVLKAITDHIEVCSDKPTADQFRYFKSAASKPQLVLTLAGHEFQDLRQGFLQALRRALDNNLSTSDFPIKAIAVKAADWLNTLSGESLTKAENYLETKYKTDVDSLAASLKNFESGKESIVKDLSRELNGIAADFGADSNLKEIIKGVVDDLCTGADAPFHKMLILFDELGVYAQRWCHNPTAAGNFAPQEIFEACSDRPGKLCFVGFVQRELSEFVQGYNLEDEFKKWAGRMPTESTYYLVSNLEEVIGKLIIKKDKWKAVIQDNSPRILDESVVVWESIQRYKEHWGQNKFYELVSRDCFPLHPFTTGLLCALDFTQGSRTIIGAVNSMLTRADDKSVSDNGSLGWIRPIELVAEFKTDFKKDSTEFSSYEYAVNTLSTDDPQVLFDVLAAIFLFREGKLKKHNRTHAEILTKLSGYSISETESALEKLKEGYDSIRYSQQKREFEFTGIGSNRNVVLTDVKREIAGRTVESLEKYLTKLGSFEAIALDDSVAREFKSDFGVEGDEWFLAPKFLDANRLNEASLKKIAQDISVAGTAKGGVVYLLSSNDAELQSARENAQSVLDNLRNEGFLFPLIVAVPHDAATQIEKQILIKNFLVFEMAHQRKLQFGDSHPAAVEHTTKEITDQLIAHLRSIDIIVPSHLELGLGKRKDLDEIADVLFADSFKFRPSSNSNLMKPTGNRGNTAIAEIGRQLILDDLKFDGLNQEKQNVVRAVLIEGHNKWGIVNSSFRIIEPKTSKVIQAWNLLRNEVSETGWTTFAGLIQKLRQPPYGYDDFTLTFLFTAWIGKHRHELGFKDDRNHVAVLGQANLNQANLTLSDLQNNLNKAKDFVRWLQQKVSVQHSGRANKRRAQDFLEQLNAVTDPQLARELVGKAIPVLQALPADDEIAKLINKRLREIEEFLSSTTEAENTLEQVKSTAIRTTDIGQLLRTIETLVSTGAKYSGGASELFSATLEFVKTRLETEAKRQSQVTLSRLESYDAIFGNLDRSYKALTGSGFTELETLFSNAIERVEAEYSQLQSLQMEQPYIAEINAIQIGGMPLRYYEDGLCRLIEILEELPSARVEKAAHSKKAAIEEQIKMLRIWTEGVQARAEESRDLEKARSLQQEIHRREQMYEDSKDSALVATALATLEGNIKSFEKEKQDKEAAEREKRRIEREQAAAEDLVSQFKQIRESEYQFSVLRELLQIVKESGLTDGQKQELLKLVK